MEVTDCLAAYISQRDQISEYTRLSKNMLIKHEISSILSEKAIIILTEIANNLVNHTQNGGCLNLNILNENNEFGIGILAFDQEPGMMDIKKCMEDGFSTTDSLGIGLGAIKRLSTKFEIYSDPKGTIILSEIWQEMKDIRNEKHHYQIGGVSLPKVDQIICGDAWVTKRDFNRNLIMVVDGLGHGVEAANVSKVAVETFKNNSNLSLSEISKSINDSLKSTRGVVLALISLDDQKNMQYAGVGNISSTILSSDGKRNLISQNGIVGSTFPAKIQETTYSFPPNSICIIYSDGLQSSWSLEEYPGLLKKDPTIIAAVLCRDFRKPSDDVTAVVVCSQ